MRVLHVIDKSFLGGGQTSVLRLLQGSRDFGIDTLLSCRAGGPLVEAARDIGTEVHTVAFDKRFRPGPARDVASIATSSSVDVIHAHGLVAAFYCTLARSFFGASMPLIYHQHGFHHHNYGPFTIGIRKAAERWVCRRANAVIPVSSADAERLRTGGYADAESIRLIYYGIPIPHMPPHDVAAVREEMAFEDDVPVVGIVGRLHPQKGIDVFLRAAAAVAAEAPAQFVIIGTGELEASHKALASDLGLDDRLRWAGGRHGVVFLPLMDVAVLSSNWEGLPFVLLEYMATGRSIVTTDVPGCLDAVRSDEAEIVPRGDDRAMADAILRLLASPERAAELATAANARYQSNFSLETMTGRFSDLYEELCA